MADFCENLFHPENHCNIIEPAENRDLSKSQDYKWNEEKIQIYGTGNKHLLI